MDGERISAVKLSLFGKGALKLLPEELKKMEVHRALIVTDTFLYENGTASQVGATLLEAEVEYAIFYEVKSNPTVEVVNNCIKVARTLQVDCIVAVGGGSAIDTAKAVSVVVANGGRIEEYEGVNKSRRPGIPIVAVNTTAGTGSEVTAFYIVTDSVRHSKMAMIDSNCMVAIAINDVNLMLSMPPELTAATGMDALTHAIEALFSIRATPLTDKDAIWAMEVIYAYLPQAVLNGRDEQARRMMAYAQNVAGMAFSNAGLGMIHSMAHALGGYYNLPHGICNAILLPYVLEFMGDYSEVQPRFEVLLKAFKMPQGYCLGYRQIVRQSIVAIRKLLEQIGIVPHLRALEKVEPKDFEILAEQAIKDTCMKDAFIKPTKEQIIKVYEKAYEGNRNKIVK
ncbi:alcohol dehydrogenase [Sporanaerobium hydrogeniformans]|uniref:Alcohol dehydrogenase n=1 Tax=Sporanaerobium hydrogeniformans TaxID=3072179 RepID=A0AC61D9J4_9FIRM|nr:iron-containing alcohol dehydrogenase [Sporanaerobium hydrogeniformans]PHV69413.1 alcohol dehydrogenase [Sporanaerobium hydrogeniformans]